ncbi:MAG: hypothetical protein AB7T10_02855 [bacterium]
MDDFKNKLEESKFRFTNNIWNDLHLNLPWSLGYTSNLIEQEIFERKEDWENYYYKSGIKRKQILDGLPSKSKSFLEKYNATFEEKMQVEEGNREINYAFGRTKQELMDKGKILFENIPNNNVGITEKDCFYCVYFRTICET